MAQCPLQFRSVSLEQICICTNKNFPHCIFCFKLKIFVSLLIDWWRWSLFWTEVRKISPLSVTFLNLHCCRNFWSWHWRKHPNLREHNGIALCLHHQLGSPAVDFSIIACSNCQRSYPQPNACPSTSPRLCEPHGPALRGRSLPDLPQLPRIHQSHRHLPESSQQY